MFVGQELLQGGFSRISVATDRTAALASTLSFTLERIRRFTTL